MAKINYAELGRKWGISRQAAWARVNKNFSCRCTFRHLLARGFKPNEINGHHLKCNLYWGEQR